MQASIACSPYVFKLVTVQSPTNFVPTILPLKPDHFTFTRTKSTSRIKLRCNSQSQPLLNLCTPKSPRNRSSNVGPLRCDISSNRYNANEGRSVGEWVVVAGEVLSTAFPLWVSIGCVLGLMKPNYFNWVSPKMSITGLNIIMLGMGMTLTLDDLREALAMPKQVLSGFALQYSKQHKKI
ncbi:putative sodium/metabolite cotransporter BASS1, chloroplastic, partial [Mucuna pruriens]